MPDTPYYDGQSVDVAGYKFPLPEGGSPEDYQPAPQPTGPDIETGATPTLAEAEQAGLRWQTAARGGPQKTGGQVVTETGRPDTPEEAAYRAQSLLAKQGIAGAEAEHLTQKVEGEEQMLRARALGEQEELQRREAEVTETEASAQTTLGELQASIQQQKDHWVRGGSPANLFDGGSGTGLLLGAVGVALAGLGGPGMQANAMQTVNSALDRSIRAQEYQTDSLFKQLETKYNDRDQARSALKMMQLQYAQTMADHYASENATPEIAINLARFQAELNDAYMQEEANVRGREYGKKTETERFTEVQGRSAGWRQETTKEKMARTDLALKQTQLLNANADLAAKMTGEAPPENWKSAQPQLRKIADMDGALSELDAAIALSGGKFTPEGSYIPDSIKAGGAIGLGAWQADTWDILQSDKSVEARNAYEGALRSLERAKRGRANNPAEGEFVKRTLRRWEDKGASGVEVARMQAELSRAELFNSLDPQVQQFYLRNREKGHSADVQRQLSPEQSGGIQEY